jgi:hypothetical protein
LEEHVLRVFRNKVLMIFGPKRKEEKAHKSDIMRSLTICTLRPILQGSLNPERQYEKDM